MNKTPPFLVGLLFYNHCVTLRCRRVPTMNTITEYGLWAALILGCLLVVGFLKNRREQRGDPFLGDVLRVVRLIHPTNVTYQSNGTFGEAVDQRSKTACRFAIFREDRGVVLIQVYAHQDGALLKEAHVWPVGPIYGHS